MTAQVTDRLDLHVKQQTPDSLFVCPRTVHKPRTVDGIVRRDLFERCSILLTSKNSLFKAKKPITLRRLSIGATMRLHSSPLRPRGHLPLTGQKKTALST